MAQNNAGSTGDNLDAMSKLTDAKARIAVWGDSLVVSSLADFFRNPGALTRPERRETLARRVASMRDPSMVVSDPLPDEDPRQ
ncbi:hypothetical protein [Salipiger aestuarii]|nr:hypothetical protein [Salipiger aestuarii]